MQCELQMSRPLPDRVCLEWVGGRTAVDGWSLIIDKKHPSTERCFSELIVVRDMLHNILNIALQNIAEFVNCICFHILVVAEAVDLGAVHIEMGVQCVLCDTTFLHCLPETVIFDHNASTFPKLLDFLPLSV